MEFTKAKKEEKNTIKNLWQYSFTDNGEYVDYYFDERYNYDYNFVIRDNQNILSSLQLNPYILKSYGTDYDISYIVGISTLPEQRGRGITSHLIKKTLNHIYENGEHFTLLMPIDTSIYTRYGFINIADMMNTTIDLQKIPIYKNNDFIVKRVHDTSNIKDLITIYNKCSQKWGFHLTRNHHYYKNILQETKLEQGNIFIVYKEDIPLSYMIFFPKNILGEKGYIRELLSTNSLGVMKLLNIVKNHYTQIKQVVIDTPITIDISKVLKSDNKITKKISPFIMGRVINVDKSFDILHQNIKSDISISIKITDEIILQNNAVYKISNSNIQKYPIETPHDIAMDISDFTSLYSGYLSLEQYMFNTEKKISEDVIASLYKLFTHHNNYFNDYV